MPAGTGVGSFIPTTNIWDDAAQLSETDVESPVFKELLVRLYQNVGNIALALNIKDTGMYVTSEFVNGQLLFSNPALNSSTTTTATLRQMYRLALNFGALPNTGTKSVPHGLQINGAYTFTRIYACSSSTSGQVYIPIPYASTTTTDVIEINVDATNVNITTSSNKSGFNITYVILEYVKS